MKKKELVILVPVIIVVLGLIGYLQEGSSLYLAILSSMKLVKVCLDPLPANVFLEIARWLGIIFFFGLIYTAIVAVLESGIVLAKARHKDSVAIHGDSIYSEMLLKSLGKKGIKSGSKMAFKAPRQVILFDNDNKALEFYQKHAAELSDAKEVHLCLELGNRVSIESDNVFITNMSEIRAIDYWRRYYCREKETITIIGSSQLAEAVLYWGLLTNVFDVVCGITYRVFGNYERFLAKHGNVEKIVLDYGGDNIIFSKSEWYLDAESIKNSDRVIICGDTLSNVETALDLKSMGINCPIHLFAENDNIEMFLTEPITIVGSLTEDNITDVLLMDSIHSAGKLCHATYMTLEKYKNDATAPDLLKTYIAQPEFINSWKRLDPFTRGSNYATAIHDPIKKELLNNVGIEVEGLTVEQNEEQYDQLNDNEKHKLQEIEHIRWCRYHLLNNWKKPEGKIVIDGVEKIKDADRHLHADLIPYGDLSIEDQNKDAYFYKSLAIRMQ